MSKPPMINKVPESPYSQKKNTNKGATRNPPRPKPEVAMELALPLFLSKYWLMTTKADVLTNPRPVPVTETSRIADARHQENKRSAKSFYDVNIITLD